MINGFLNINKPDNITSFGVLAKLKKQFKVIKFGHMGTLDPAGVGVLPIAVGKATKLFNLFSEHKKVYRAIFVFGKETDTLDSFGEVVKKSSKIISKQLIEEKLCNFVGELDQLPPKFSAKKINGVRAYDLARNGEDFDLKPKRICVSRFELVEELEENTFLFEIECSTGTYIRSLCRDLANCLGTVGYMPLIIRLKMGDFEIDNAKTLNQILSQNDIKSNLIPIENVVKLQQINLSDSEFVKVRNGMMINFNKEDGKYYLNYKENIFAVGQIKDKMLKMEIYLDD